MTHPHDDDVPPSKPEQPEPSTPETGNEATNSEGERTDPLSTRRKWLGVLGLTFLTSGFSKAASPLVPRAACGAPHGSGVGYQEDYNCEGKDADCGLVTSNPLFGGRGGASYHDNDCNPTAKSGQDGKDNDCGKLSEWGNGGHRDDDCGKYQGDGTYATDNDCDIDNGQMTNGGWQDQDCGLTATTGDPGTKHKDSNPGNRDDEVCTYWDSNCNWWDTYYKPKRGDDPACIHLDNN